MAEKYFSIFAGIYGNDPKPVEIGMLDKDLGRPTGQTQKVLAHLGQIAIPNRSVIWAEVEYKDGKPTGEFKPLPWGTADRGGATAIRYLPSAPSLLVEHQDNVVKVKETPEDIEIILAPGINIFDEVKESRLIKFLKLHTYYEQNASRNPDREIVFREHNATAKLDKALEATQIRNKAEGIVLNARKTPGQLEVLAAIFGEDDKAPADEIADLLLTSVTSNPALFVSKVDDKILEFHYLLQKANSYGLLDTMTIPEEVQLIVKSPGAEPKKETLFTDIPTPKKGFKGDKLQLLADSFLDVATYDAANRLKGIVKQYEESL